MKNNKRSKRLIYFLIALLIFLVVISIIFFLRSRKDSDELEKSADTIDRVGETQNGYDEEKKELNEVVEKDKENENQELKEEIKKDNLFESVTFPFTFEHDKDWSYKVQEGFLADKEICLLSSSWQDELDKLKREAAATDAPPCLITILYSKNNSIKEAQEDYLKKLGLSADGVENLPSKNIGEYQVEIIRTIDTLHEMDVYFLEYENGVALFEVWTTNGGENSLVAEEIIGSLE